MPPIEKAIGSSTSAPEAGLQESKPGLEYDSVLGAASGPPQYGLLGETSGRKVALDLNQTHTISLFGVQGGGKSYTLGSIIEMACMPIAGSTSSRTHSPASFFHYSSTLDYRPEFTSMSSANAVKAEMDALQARYAAAPRRSKTW